MIRTLLLALAFSSTAFAAELQTLEGRKLTGEIVSIVGSDLTFKSNGMEEKFLVTTLHSVSMGKNAVTPDAGKKYTVVEFVDGSSFRCSEIVLKGKNIEMKLLGGDQRTMTVPMRGVVLYFNREVGDLKLEQDFRERMRNRGRHDVWVTKRKTKNDMGVEVDLLDGVPGTFGDGDAEKKEVQFALVDQAAKPILMSRVSGVILAQAPLKDSEGRPIAIPPAICKVIDTDGNEYVAQAVARTDKGFAITTVTNVKVDLPEAQISKFDFAAGAIKYLSDLDPVALDESGTDPEHYQKDKNLDKRTIRLVIDPAAGRTEAFPKGITLKAKTVITYELKGGYKTFRAIAGVDADPDNVAPSQVKITIDDGMAVLYSGKLKKGDKPIDLNLPVQNVDRLKITVESDGTVIDAGNQVSLANARVLK